MIKRVNKKIPVAEPDFSGNESAYVQDALLVERRVSSSGKYLDRFEKEFGAYCGREYALTTSNGTTALHLALLALGVGPGDEVIVPSFTFAATAAVVCQAGATPIFIDAKREDWTLDEEQLESIRTPRTKALITVDVYGTPCNYDFIEVWCKEHKIFLVEDAAEAHGAVYKGKRVGGFGDVSCFSFFGNKIITTGEGGMCLTDDPDLHERMRVLRNHGMRTPGVYDHDIVGYNYRMTNLQAAVGCAQLERIGEFIARRKEHDALYRSLFSGFSGITFQPIPETVEASFWFFNILTDRNVEELRTALKERGIETRPLFKPLSDQKAYQHFAEGQTFRVARELFARGITLPSSPLLSQGDIEHVVSCVKKILV
jgi:perosamine synthetase